MFKRHLRGKRHSIILFTAVLLLVALLACCTFSAAASIFLSNARQRQLSAIEHDNNALVEQFSANLQGLVSVGGQLEYNSFIRNYLNTAFMGVDLLELSKILSSNAAVATANPNVLTIDLYNRSEGKVLSTVYGYYDSANPSSGAAMFVRQMDRFADSGERSALMVRHIPDELPLLTHCSYVSKTNRVGVLAVSAMLENLLPELGRNVEWYLTYTDGTMRTIDLATGAPVPLEVLDMLSQTGEKWMGTAGEEEKLFVTRYNVWKDALTLYAAVPESMLHVNLYHQPRLFVLLAVLFALCVAGAGVVCYVAYRPLRKMLSGQSGKKLSVRTDAIGELQALLYRYAEQETNLRRSIESGKDALYVHALRDLLCGRADSRAELAPPLFRESGNHFVLAYLLFSQTGNAQPDALHLDACVCEIRDRMEMPCERVTMGPRCFVLLMNPEAEEDAALIEYRLTQACNATLLWRECSAAIGLSEMCRTREELCKCYEQAAEAARAVEQISGVHCLRASEIKRSKTTPVLSGRELVQALRTQGMEEVRQALCAAIEGVEEGASADALFLYLASCVYRVAGEFGATSEMFTQNAFDLLGVSREARMEYLLSLCTAALDARANADKQYKHTSVEVVVKYLRANFDKPLSLSVLAQDLGISASYLSELLKKELNMNYTKYVQGLRIARAKELLLKTDSGVEEIAGMVGYDSKHSFIRNFKAAEGVTPTQYRLSNA